MSKADEQRNALRGLAGRGPLAAFSNAPRPAGQGDLELALERLSPMPAQARRRFDPEGLENLAASIRASGVLQPLVVRPAVGGGFEIVAGERRWRAARLAGLETVPCLVRVLDDQAARLTNATENLQREDLNPVEEVEALLEILALELNRPRDGVISLLHRMRNEARGRVTHTGMGNPDAARIEAIFRGLNRTWPSFVANNLRVLRLPGDVFEAVREGRLEYTKGLLVARLKDQTARRALLSEALERGLTKRQIEERIANLTVKPRAPAEVALLELNLARRFGTRVRLTGSERGQLRVGFSSREDL